MSNLTDRELCRRVELACTPQAKPPEAVAGSPKDFVLNVDRHRRYSGSRHCLYSGSRTPRRTPWRALTKFKGGAREAREVRRRPRLEHIRKSEGLHPYGKPKPARINSVLGDQVTRLSKLVLRLPADCFSKRHAITFGSVSGGHLRFGVLTASMFSTVSLPACRVRKRIAALSGTAASPPAQRRALRPEAPNSLPALSWDRPSSFNTTQPRIKLSTHHCALLSALTNT